MTETQDRTVPAIDRDDALHRLLSALAQAGEFGVAPAKVDIVETHISIVALAGDHVWKFKKPVNFGFLDFSTIEQRRRYCHLELELNRRYSPDYYLSVVAVVGTVDAPRLVVDPDDNAIEYAVKMRRFPADAEFERLLQRGELTDGLVARLAERVATIHESARVAADFGTPAQVLGPALDNFRALQPLLGDDGPRQASLATLRAWTEREAAARHAVFLARQRGNRVRECHGDLHLGNIALDGETIVLFDCIEFSDALRCIDVISEAAFVCVDLDAHGRADLGNLFLNRYLEGGGDYDGVRVLRFYRVYRALVRAKVAALRAAQGAATDLATIEARDRCGRYVDLAQRYLEQAPCLFITHGLSGSGKSVLADHLARRIGAIRVRSDVERKRLHGLHATTRGGAGIDEGIYAAGASSDTYARLGEVADIILRAGFPVIVDAACLRRRQRDGLAAVARNCGVPFRIVSLTVPESELRRRLLERSRAGLDASDADVNILEHQLATQEPLSDRERDAASIITNVGDEPAVIVERLLAGGEVPPVAEVER